MSTKAGLNVTKVERIREHENMNMLSTLEANKVLETA